MSYLMGWEFYLYIYLNFSRNKVKMLLLTEILIPNFHIIIMLIINYVKITGGVRLYFTLLAVSLCV